jgi:hypothetical protein
MRSHHGDSDADAHGEPVENRPDIPLATRTRSAMTEQWTRTDDPDTGWYEIQVAGALGDHWASWFDGMTLDVDGDGTTVISGPVADQAVLHGLLGRLRDLGIPLVSLARIEPPQDPSHAGTPASSTPMTGELFR